MSGTNSKNFTFIILMVVIVVFVFSYIVISNHVNGTMYTDVKETEVDE